MMQKIIVKKYDLKVIGLIRISSRLYKVKTTKLFYYLKIVDDKYLEDIYHYLKSLNLKYFVEIIKNNDNNYLTAYLNQYFYIMPCLRNDAKLTKEVKIKKYYQILAYLHQNTFITKLKDDSYFIKEKNKFIDLIDDRERYYNNCMEKIEFQRYKSPALWMLVLNYYAIINCLQQAREFVFSYYEMMIDKKEIRLTMVYSNYDINHIFFNENKLIAIDKIKEDSYIYDLLALLQSNDLCEAITLLDVYLERIELLKEEKILLAIYLYIIPKVKIIEDEKNNIFKMAKLICYMDSLNKIIEKLKIDGD